MKEELTRFKENYVRFIRTEIRNSESNNWIIFWPTGNNVVSSFS